MSGRSRSRMTGKLERLHEEEELAPIVSEAYELAIKSYTGPVQESSIQSIVKNHMTDSVIMSLGKHTPHNGNSVDEAIENFLSSRDVHGNIIRSRYISRVAHKRRMNGSRGGKRSDKRRATRRCRKRA